MKQQRFARMATCVLRTAASRTFFGVVLGLFVVQAAWIACSGAYSMAFDEYFHFGIIKLFAQQWSPWLPQPDGPAIYGAVARDPSYLYHYLMSFPYRVFAYVVPSLTAQIIFLRCIDIVVFAVGLVVLRKLLLRAGLPRAVSHILLLFLVCLPVVPFMAGQLNYDNLLFLGTVLSVYMMLRWGREVRESHTIPLRTTLLLGGVVLLSSVVKYAFLPIALGLAIYMLMVLARTFGWRLSSVLQALRRGFMQTRGWTVVFALLLCVGGAVLFMERYGGNTVRYHTPTPACDRVLDLETCRAFDPFGRNQSYKERNLRAYVTTGDKLEYPADWVRAMMRSLLFAVGPREAGYPAGEPLPVARATAWTIAAISVVCIGWNFRRLWRSSDAARLFLVVSTSYILVLFGQNFADYVGLGVPVAIQGRYLMPVLPLLVALAALAALPFLRRWPLRVTLTVTLVLFIGLASGGGLLPFIIRSGDDWMWAHSFMERANHTLRSLLWPLVVR